MPLVKSSHCWHETDRAVVVKLFATPLAEGGDISEHLNLSIRDYWIFGASKSKGGAREGA